jgi:crossover junction endodeoxyribonuclease RuvC
LIVVLGIDPGIRGGLAIVSDAVDGIGTLIDAVNIPVVGDGASERVDAAAIRDWVKRFNPVLAFIERAQAMPRQGASSGFKYGRATGSIEATIALCTVAIEIIEPVKWKRFWKLPPKDKERSRQRALELFPSAHTLLARKKDHGLAEAALIALYGLCASRSIVPPPGASTKSDRLNLLIPHLGERA